MLVSAASDGARAGAQASPAHAELNGRAGKPGMHRIFQAVTA